MGIISAGETKSSRTWARYVLQFAGQAAKVLGCVQIPECRAFPQRQAGCFEAFAGIVQHLLVTPVHVLKGGWIGFTLGQSLGGLLGISVLRMGQINFVAASLGALLALIAARIFSSERPSSARR